MKQLKSWGEKVLNLGLETAVYKETRVSEREREGGRDYNTSRKLEEGKRGEKNKQKRKQTGQ